MRFVKSGTRWTCSNDQAGYEGGGPPYNPIPSNRYEYDGKGLKAKMLLDFIES